MRTLTPLLLLYVVLVSTACHRRAKTSVSVPTLQVEVASVREDTITPRYRFSTHLESRYEVSIQPRVSGYLLSKHYEAGMPVERGDLLFRLDANLLTASMLSAEAHLSAAEADAIKARNDYERARPLAELEAISASQLDQYTAAYSSAQQAVVAAREALRSARLQVGYATIYAPIDGIVAHSEAHEGDYVGPSTKFSVLTTIASTDTLTAEIAIPTSLYMLRSERGTPSFDNRGLLSDIWLHLSDGSRYPLQGVYDYTRQSISPTAGTIRLVVDFPNPEGRLKSGEYAEVECGIGKPQRCLLIPQRAVTTTQNIRSVWVIGADNTVEWREIEVGESVGNDFIILSGLQAGERVALTGGQKLHRGAKVEPKM